MKKKAPSSQPRPRGKLLIGLLATSIVGLVGAVLVTASPSSGIRPVSDSETLTQAKVAFADRRFVEAEKLVRDAGDSGRLLLARILLERGRLVEARELFSHLLKAEPENPDVLRGMAGVLKGMGQGEAAVSYLEKAARLRNSADDWKALGLAQKERGDTLGALTAIQQSLKCDSQQADLSAMLSDLVTGKDALAGTSPGAPKAPGFDPLNSSGDLAASQTEDFVWGTSEQDSVEGQVLGSKGTATSLESRHEPR